MTIVLPYAVFLAAAFSLFVVFGLKSVESLFITLCSAMVLMFAFALSGAITLGVYVIVSIAALSFVFAVVFIIRKKINILDALKGFVSPAFAALSVSVLLFTVLTANVRLVAWDDATHWGLAVKVLYTLDGFPREPGILGAQTSALPLLNCFIVKLAGYREGFMLSGLWLFAWTCLMLPAANVKWKNYKSIVLYCLFSYAVVIISRPVDALSLMMDSVLGIMSAGLAAYYFINRKSGSKMIPVLFAGLFILAQAKLIFGLLFAVFILALIAYERASSKNAGDLPQNRKEPTGNFLILACAPIISMIADMLLRPLNDAVIGVEGPRWNQLLPSIKSALVSPVGIALIIAALLGAAAAVFMRKKKKKTALAGIFALAAACLGLAGYIFLRLDPASKALINAFIKNLLTVEIFGVQGYKLAGIMAVLAVMFYYLGVSEPYRKKYVRMGAAYLVLAAVYPVCLMVSYSLFSEYEAMNGASMDRYLSSFVLFSGMSFVMCLFFSKPLWHSEKAFMKFVFLMIFFTIIIFPKPLYLYDYQKSSPFGSSLPGGVEYHSNMISSKTDENAKVYLIAQKDSGFIAHWAKYNIFPRKVNTSANSIGPAKYEGDIWSVDYSDEEWEKVLAENGYTHLYIVDIDEYFVETFSGMFSPGTPVRGEILYEITKDGGGNIVFVPASG